MTLPHSGRGDCKWVIPLRGRWCKNFPILTGNSNLSYIVRAEIVGELPHHRSRVCKQSFQHTALSYYGKDFFKPFPRSAETHSTNASPKPRRGNLSPTLWGKFQPFPRKTHLCGERLLLHSLLRKAHLSGEDYFSTPSRAKLSFVGEDYFSNPSPKASLWGRIKEGAEKADLTEESRWEVLLPSPQSPPANGRRGCR